MRALDLPFLLELDVPSGKLFWKERPFFMFPNAQTASNWNAEHAGKEAFTAKSSDGYLRGSILSKKVMGHRVVWAMLYGSWPAMQLDHINGVRDDNRPANLREVSNLENSRNSSISDRNSSGTRGVYFDKRRSKWIAQIGVNYKTVHLGSFDDLDDAVACRKMAESQHGFHRNHGRLTRAACVALLSEGGAQ